MRIAKARFDKQLASCCFAVLLLLLYCCFAIVLLFFYFVYDMYLQICRTTNSNSTVRNKTTKSQAPPHCAFTIPSAYRLRPTTARDCNEARAEGLGSSLQYFRQETFQPFVFRISEELIWSVLFLYISTVHEQHSSSHFLGKAHFMGYHYHGHTIVC